MKASSVGRSANSRVGLDEVWKVDVQDACEVGMTVPQAWQEIAYVSSRKRVQGRWQSRLRLYEGNFATLARDAYRHVGHGVSTAWDQKIGKNAGRSLIVRAILCNNGRGSDLDARGTSWGRLFRGGREIRARHAEPSQAGLATIVWRVPHVHVVLSRI